MTLLNQIIAVEKGIKNNSRDVLSTAYKVAQKPELFNGFEKVYRKKNEESEDLPPERKPIQTNVPEMLDAVKTAFDQLAEITARKDWTNSTAKADLVVSGQTIAEGVPVTYLLFLEKELTDLKTFAEKLPILDTTESWAKSNADDFIFTSATTSTHRTKKVNKPIVLYPATDKHPAQVQMITEDEVVGNWDTTKVSGAIPRQLRDSYVERITTLLTAVKVAREAANSTPEIESPKIGKNILRYIFG